MDRSNERERSNGGGRMEAQVEQKDRFNERKAGRAESEQKDRLARGDGQVEQVGCRTEGKGMGKLNESKAEREESQTRGWLNRGKPNEGDCRE